MALRFRPRRTKGQVVAVLVLFSLAELSGAWFVHAWNTTPNKSSGAIITVLLLALLIATMQTITVIFILNDDEDSPDR